MKLWADFHPYVLPDVTGCPIPLLDQALRDTARDFCTRTKAWRQWMDPFTASGSSSVYEFEADQGTEVVAAVAVSVAGEDYSVLGSHALPASWQSGEQGRIKDKTMVHISSSEGVFYPMPMAGDSIVFQLALRPPMSGTGVGDVIFAEFTEAIAAGTKARLMAKPRKEWTDLQTAAMFGMQYERMVHLAANTAWHQSAERRTTKATG